MKKGEPQNCGSPFRFPLKDLFMKVFAGVWGRLFLRFAPGTPGGVRGSAPLPQSSHSSTMAMMAATMATAFSRGSA